MAGTSAPLCLGMGCEEFVNNSSRYPYAPHPVHSRISQEVWSSLENLSAFLTRSRLRAPTGLWPAVLSFGFCLLRGRRVGLDFDLQSSCHVGVQVNRHFDRATFFDGSLEANPVAVYLNFGLRK